MRDSLSFYAMFKKNLNVYFASNSGGLVKMPVYPDVSFSQVYTEEELKKKTLHNPENLISDGFTSVLNVGNFSFTIPMMDSIAFQTILSIMLEAPVKSHTLYFENKGVIKKLHSVVFTEAVFNIGRNELMTVSMTGNFSHGTNEVSIPGTPSDFSGDLYTYVEGMEVQFGATIYPNINSFSIESKTGVKWLENKTIHDNGPKYRDKYITEDRIISGNVVQYADMSLPAYSDGYSMRTLIKANGEVILDFDFPKVIMTTRNQLDDITKKGIDYRVTGNTGNQIRYKGVNII